MGRPLKAAVWDLKVRMLENALAASQIQPEKSGPNIGADLSPIQGTVPAV